MLLWVPQALLALLLPMLLAQGEGKATVGKCMGFAWPPVDPGRGGLTPPSVEGRRVVEWVLLQESQGSWHM